MERNDMNSTVYAIRSFAKDASLEDYAALNLFTNRIRLERLPDDPPVPVEETIQNIQSIPPFVDMRIWACWGPDQGEIIAAANVAVFRMEENQHVAQFEISVLPGYRQQGIGRQLLEQIAAFVQQENRRLLLTNTVDRIPAGETFMQRIGAKKGLEAHTNQLRMTDLNRALVASWLASGQNNLDAFELGFWDGAYPDEQLNEIVELHELTNQQPKGDLDIEDMHMTPQQIRQMEHNIFARGNQRWTFYLIDRASGKFAGYTETVWSANRPEILRQDLTGIFPQYRNKGLGRWLKAVMLDKVIRDRPEVKFVRTGNADSNAAMLKINTELGFKPYSADAIWQVELSKVLEYLQA
jgi:GNAT superfamily N-acetyltransferase